MRKNKPLQLGVAIMKLKCISYAYMESIVCYSIGFLFCFTHSYIDLRNKFYQWLILLALEWTC